MMENNLDYYTSQLELCSYRYLQQLAKSMKLPSNVKKIYLLEMINAKKRGAESEVQRIIHRVKKERQQHAQAKKKSRRTIIPLDSSSNESASPAISDTPKRPACMLRCSELRHQMMRSQNNTVSSTTTYPGASDRVLRSCNVKVKPFMNKFVEVKQRHVAMVDRHVANVARVDRHVPMADRHVAMVDRHVANVSRVGRHVANVARVDRHVANVARVDRHVAMVNRHVAMVDRHVDMVDRHVANAAMVDQGTQMNPVRVVKRYKPNILASQRQVPVTQMRQVPVTQMRQVPVTQMGTTQILVKRPRSQRLLSGIYPITKELVPVGGWGVRNSEGKMAALAAFIHKPQDDSYTSTSSTSTRSTTSLTRNIEMTLQDMINGNVEQATTLNYPNTSGVEAVPVYTETTPETVSSVYYHKKIRAEQVRERRCTLNTRCELPRINEAFGQFRGNHIRHDVTQPLYVQVSEESERILNYPMFAQCNTGLLETVYNFKSNFLTHQPLLQLATTTNTKCVYSTPIVATAAPHRPATPYTEPYMASYERDLGYYTNTDNSRMNDCLRFAEQDYDFRCYEDPNRSNSSIGTVQSQDLGANVTISDMVEDALELISQDGDYMERMGMDVRMQCVLCEWAGPKMILEYHIRKDHPNEIDKQDKREWNITYSLGSVHQQLWKSRVIEHESALYVLSVKYEPTGCFMATLSALSTDPELTTASITVFNKVTGEPHTWIGDIQELPPSLPYDTQPGLQLDLANLDLIPNSANLKLVDGELVLQSPTKVVFGQIELNDIHIILFVKIS